MPDFHEGDRVQQIDRRPGSLIDAAIYTVTGVFPNPEDGQSIQLNGSTMTYNAQLYELAVA